MRVYDIALALFLFNISAGIVSGLGIFPGGVGIAEQSAFADFSSQVEAAQTQLSKPVSSDPIGDIAATVQLTVGAVVSFVGIMFQLPVAFPALLKAANVPDVLTIGIGFATVMVYVIAIVQFFRGQSVKEGE